ncbi:stalk domain-containing protein [Paenibacillus nasutitermitis]|uniref:Lysophospholipase L1 n=1 Tax=Paenibacillus nasutitermitis TaxID=1652958 RepID=A0A916Z6C7_9BACL|nr:stalk domain-containing protein [Paenibacillus nasutitermitis]GGD76280.1 hypothetical protein GCM10010911_37940 [Paenibacillus nasutitermitis]
MSSNFRKTNLAACVLAASLMTGTAAYAEQAAKTPSTTRPAAVHYAAGLNETAADPALSAPLRIAAVGDSLTAGYENGLAENAVPYGYADRVYEQALYHGAAEFKNFGVLGLKSEGLRKWLEAAQSGTGATADDIQPGISKYRFAPETLAKSAELRMTLEQADLIVMTIGGNDFLPLFDEIKQRVMSPDDIQAWIDTMLESYKQSLEGALTAALGINPGAQLVFADQYLPVPKPSTLNKAITDEQYAVLQGAVKKLRELDEAVAANFRTQGYKVTTVDVSEPFMGKELAYTSILQGDIHPKQAGYEQMGKAFAKGIWGEYRELAPLPADVPLNIVINGGALSGSNKPILKNDTTFLPMRDIANALKAQLAWDAKTKTATIQANNKVVAFTIGAKTMKVDGIPVPLETPPYLQQNGKNSFTYLPLAALSRGLGYQVVYRKPLQAAFINS